MSPEAMQAVLVLENGKVYRGAAAGATGEARGEVVFNTSMTGYQEILTDPSYAGQIVTMTCPQIGNYGVAPGDKPSGFLMRRCKPKRRWSSSKRRWGGLMPRGISTRASQFRSNATRRCNGFKVTAGRKLNGC